MKTQSSNSMNFLVWKYLAIVAALLVTFAYAQPCAAQQKPGWTLIFDDEFNENNVDDLFSSTGLWCSLGGCWDPEGYGLSYDSPVPPWNPIGCDNPITNTALTGSGTMTLTARKNPGNYTVYEFPTATLFKGSVWAAIPSGGFRDLTTGDPVADKQGAIPPGTTIKHVIWFAGSTFLELSNAATASAKEDLLSLSTCKPYIYTAAAISSKRAFLYGYFEIKAKIPLRGNYTWPSFWLWGEDSANTYRELDVFEFGTPNIKDDVLMNLHLAQGIDGGDPSSSQRNTYPGTYVLSPADAGGDVTDSFHTYAARWTPNSVTWYVDDQQVYQVAGHTPHLDMHLIAGTDIQGWIPTPDSVLPANYEMGYIRVYRSQSNEFMWQWGNAGGDVISGWNMNASDRYIAGKFEGNGKAQLLAIAANRWGWAKMMDFNGSSWDTPWGNGGTDKINWWDMNVDDKYIVGDFAGLGRDQLLAMNDDNGWAQLMNYNSSSSSWNTPWGTGGGKIGSWYMHKEDQYIAGDFAGLGCDQVLAINYADGWAQLLEYYGGSWHTIWNNGGSHWISGWYLSAGDKYLSGNFQGNVNGQKGLLAISANGNGYAALVQYSGGNWNVVWGNSGSGKINWWNINPTDKYLVGNFDGGKQDQLLAIATNKWGWAQLMNFNGSGWDTPWGNDGGATIDLWYMHPSDKYVPGDFNGHGQADLFVAATNGWAQLMQRALP